LGESGGGGRNFGKYQQNHTPIIFLFFGDRIKSDDTVAKFPPLKKMSISDKSTMSSLNSLSSTTTKQTTEGMRKMLRTKRKENDLRRMLHSYDLTSSNPTQVKRLAEVFDDIGTRSSCPTHLIYSPKKIQLKNFTREKTEYIKGLKDHKAEKNVHLERLEQARRDYGEKIEKIKDEIETDVEDIDFLKQQMQAQKERIASHQDAPRAQERDAEAGMILPVTGYNNASQLNKRMVEKSLQQLVKRIMNKRAEVNDAIGENNKIKYVIDNLRRERHTFQQIFGDMHEDLTNIKNQIKDDEEYTTQTNNDRRDLNTEIINAINERDENNIQGQKKLEEMEQARLDEIRLEQLAKDADEEKRRQERWRKREEAKARRKKAKEEHQRKHDAHMKNKNRNMFGGGGDDELDELDAPLLEESSILNGGISALDSNMVLNGGESSMISDIGNAGGAVLEEMFAEWNKTWSKLLAGTNIRQRVMNELYGTNGGTDVNDNQLNTSGRSNGSEEDDGSKRRVHHERRQSARPILASSKSNGSSGGHNNHIITHNNVTSMSLSELNASLRNRLCYELRSNAEADFQLMQQLNELKNKKDALNNELREITIETRQLERIQKEGGSDDADLATFKLIKRLENEKSKLDRVVNQELDTYNQNLSAVDTFCDEITTCYLRTGAGGAKEDGGNDDEEEEEEEEEDGTGKNDGVVGNGGSSPASPTGRRRSSSAVGNENDNGNSGEAGGGNGSDQHVKRLKPLHYRALDNLRAIEQHVNNTILLYAAQPIINAQAHNNNNNNALSSSGGSGSTSTKDLSMTSSALNLLSPHQQQIHQQNLLTPKERHELIVSRIGQVSAVTATRTIEQKIPRVDIPEDMEVAFGFDPDAMDDKPFLKNEVSQQLKHQLQRIKEETNARMTNSLGSTVDNNQQSGISSAGLIDTAHKIRAEKVRKIILIHLLIYNFIFIIFLIFLFF
jgi:hypothetical protein